jgi:phosphoribosyl 1,2-cyclic phosphate phosphodiesterase
MGTGTSHGVPMIGCDCRTCRSEDPRDKRNRASVSIRVKPDRAESAPPTAAVPHREAADDEAVLLIDTPPELRLAAIATSLSRVDAVLITHAHADHILGMDDLRRYNDLRGGPIDVYGAADSITIIRKVFGYAEAPYDNFDRPSLRFREMAGAICAAGVGVTPVPLVHGQRMILGYRIGPVAYCTDCSAIPPASWPLLEDLELLILGCLRYTPHPAHFNVEGALATIERLGPRRTLLTHIAHEIGHAELSARLPDNIQPAFDGQRVELLGLQASR